MILDHRGQPLKRGEAAADEVRRTAKAAEGQQERLAMKRLEEVRRAYLDVRSGKV
jgi:hypothetical protein